MYNNEIILTLILIIKNIINLFKFKYRTLLLVFTVQII